MYAEKIAVSVIVPVYNAEKYLECCVESILHQSIAEIELILVDDGSTDSSGRMCDLFRKRDPRIQVIHQSNGGPAKARNAGLRAAKGDYIGFVDSDDWIEEKMYETMYGAAVREDADIVWCNIIKNDDEKQIKYLESKTYDRQGIEEFIFPRLISNVNERTSKGLLRGSVCIRLFRKSMIDRFNILFPESLIYNEDGMFCVQATIHAQKYVYLGDDYLYHNRYVQGSLTKRYILGLWEKQRGIIDLLQEYTCGCDYDFSHQINKKLFDVAVYCIENVVLEGKTANIRQIKLICNDKILRQKLKLVKFSLLRNISRGYYLCILLKTNGLFRYLYAYRYRNR